jgi:hypothetical protein
LTLSSEKKSDLKHISDRGTPEAQWLFPQEKSHFHQNQTSARSFENRF